MSNIFSKAGGLLMSGLKTVGHNFDRNAAGPLPQLLGADYTPDMRRQARANAVMAIGQHLQGTQPIAQGLQQGQQQIFGGWQAGQQLKREREARAAMSGMTQDLTGGGSPPAPADAGAGGPAAPPDPAQITRAHADKYRAAATKMLMAGLDKHAEHLSKIADSLDKRADALDVKPVGEPKSVRGADGKPMLLQQMSNGKFVPVAGYSPEAKNTVINTGGTSRVVDMLNPEQTSFTNTASPDAVMSNDRQSTEFKKMFPIHQQQADASTMGAQASRTSAAAASQNAITGVRRETRETMEAGQPKPMSGEASKVAAIAITMVPEIQQLKKALTEGGASAIWGIKSGSNMPLVRLASQVADKVGRLRSGGAINKEEESRFMQQIVSWMDLKEGASSGADAALTRLENEANLVSRGVDPKMLLPRGDPSTPRMTIKPIK